MSLRIKAKAVSIALSLALGITMAVSVVIPGGNLLDWTGLYLIGGSASRTEAVVEHYVVSTMKYIIPATALSRIYKTLFANNSLTLMATTPAITVGTATASTSTPAPTPTPTPASTPSPTTLASASWYVSTTGSDSSDGRTLDTPFRTIGNAVSVVQPGDVIFVRGGVYGEYIKITNSGSSDRPITLSGYPGETAIIDGSGRTPDPSLPRAGYGDKIPATITVTGNYITVQNLEVRNSASWGILVQYSHNVLLNALHIHDTYLSGVYFWATQDCTIQNSTVHDAYDYNNLGYSGGNADGIGVNGFSTHLTIRNNECYHNSDDGIDVGNSTYALVEGNHCHHNGFDQGDAEGCKVLNGTNNTFQNNVAHDQRIGFDSGNNGGNFFYNNTAYNNYQTDYIEYYGNTSVNTGNSWN
jgi:parallel beta-helix repeat protein